MAYPKKVKKKMLKISTIAYSVLIICALLIIGNAFLIYFFNLNNEFEKKTEKIIPYPGIIINYIHFIRLSEINENLQAVKNFYENQDFSKVGFRIDFSTEDGKKRLKIKEKEIINKMLEDRIIVLIADKNNIKISKDDIDQNVQRALDEYGNDEENIKEKLLALYGWTIADFKEKIVKPDLYKRELQKIYKKDAENDIQKIRNVIEKAKVALDGGEDFSGVAVKYSTGMSGQDGGELGWFKKDQIMPELSPAIFSLKKNERTGILESELGFHIVELEDFKNIGNERDMVRIRQIFVAKKSFPEWLGEKIQIIKIFIPLHDYRWNQESGIVEFTDEEMKKFEEKVRNESLGDASVS